MSATEFGQDKYSLHRSLDRWQRFAFHGHDSVKLFCATPLADGLHSIDCDGVILDLTVSGKKGAPLVICLNGNVPRSGAHLPPFFSGFGVMPAGIALSHVAVNDPTITLTADLTLSWYAGSGDVKLQNILPSVFDRIIEELEPSSVIFFGGSGGGFASLYYANKVKDSIALVWNPQTDILSYNPPHIRAYAAAAFGIDNDADLGLLADYVDTKLPFDGSNQRCKIIYLQNGSDGHVKLHLNRMLKRMGLPERAFPFDGMMGDDFFLYIGDWGQGHAVPPKHVLTALLERLLADPKRAFSDDGAALSATLREAFATTA